MTRLRRSYAVAGRGQEGQQGLRPILSGFFYVYLAVNGCKIVYGFYALFVVYKDIWVK